MYLSNINKIIDIRGYFLGFGSILLVLYSAGERFIKFIIDFLDQENICIYIQYERPM